VPAHDGESPGPLGSAYASIVPYRAFPTKDIDIAIAVGSDKLWRAFGPAISHAELVDDPAYATNAMRVKNRLQLESFLEDVFCTDIMENWRIKLHAAGIPASPVRRLDEVVNDPQCAVREMFPYTTDPIAGQVRIVGSPIKFTNQPASALSSAPELGQHTKQTLSD
jgi:formyl-CoA transferase/CoA:oxalate CoA-transferase